MHRRFRTPCRVLLVALVCLVALGFAPHASGEVIKLTTLVPKGSSYHRALQRMGEAWRDASGGKFEVIIYAGGIQGGEAAMVERMWINQAQAGLLTAVGLEEIEPEVAGLQNMPMMFRSLDELDHVASKVQPRLERQMLAKGFVVLAWVDAGWIRFFSRSRVVEVDDLKKLKLFTWAGDTKVTDLMIRAGLKPVPLETSDILTGLETGLIDAAPLPPYFALASQIYRPAPHMLDLEWAPLVGALVITERAWNRVPAELRPAFREAAREAGAEIKSTGRRESEQSIETMKAQWNLTVHPLTTEAERGWRKAVDDALPAIRGGMVPEKTYDEVVRLLEEYRASAGESP